jgi:hypothetical protein
VAFWRDSPLTERDLNGLVAAKHPHGLEPSSMGST